MDFHFLVMEKSWKNQCWKRGAPWHTQFSALTLLVGWQEAIWLVNKPCFSNLPLGTWPKPRVQFSSVVCCYRAGFWRPFSVSPYLSVLSCRLCVSIPVCPQLPVWVQRSHPSSFAISCSIWILLLPLVGLPLILPSVISCKSLVMSHRCFLFQTDFSICLALFTLLRTLS